MYMRHFNFETNIEERLPWNGKVYFVNRMTSDYAERYPLNVDEFVNGIASKYGADAQRVRQFFYYGLGKPGESRSTHCPAKFKDKIKKDGTIIFGKYPDYMNGSEPAMVEAWHKGVEYHTKGLRQGDTLPQIVPPCKITRLEGGWIALFPKDMHLLENRIETAEPAEMALAFDEAKTEESDLHKIENDNGEPDLDLNLTTMNDVATAETAVVPAVETAECKAEESAEQVREQDTTDQNATAACHSGVTPAPEPFVSPDPEYRRSQREIPAGRPHQRRQRRESQRQSYEERMERETREAEQAAREVQQKKIFAAVGAAAVTLVMIHFFGLFGPAVFGLVCGGLLKG